MRTTKLAQVRGMPLPSSSSFRAEFRGRETSSRNLVLLFHEVGIQKAGFLAGRLLRPWLWMSNPDRRINLFQSFTGSGPAGLLQILLGIGFLKRVGSGFDSLGPAGAPRQKKETRK